ncbi:MAG: hypothetical protein JO326_09250 [Acetobacteraceae bacterium]|nr:hypothetical protein [Acetobacteraceae bacterium]
MMIARPDAPFPRSLVFPDVGADVLEAERALEGRGGRPVWPAYLRRMLGRIDAVANAGGGAERQA